MAGKFCSCTLIQIKSVTVHTKFHIVKKIKVKFALEQAVKVRSGSRVIALLFL
jgi:hypothetical protein